VVIWDDATMINANPQFVNPAADDFHIQHTSPCKDSGLANSSTPLLDYEGDPRVADGTIDMGADEFYPHMYYTGQAIPMETIQVKCIGRPGDALNAIILGASIFDPPLPCDYGWWYMDQTLAIITGLGMLPSSGVSIFPGKIPRLPAGPYTLYLQAAIDQVLTNLCTVNVQ
jgi:hypothetical protein